jgi:hypothetical protein
MRILIAGLAIALSGGQALAASRLPILMMR